MKSVQFLWRRVSPLVLAGAACFLASPTVWGDTMPLTFEGLDDSQSVDRFYPGVAFTNAVAEIAGISLNDAEFPPASGDTVAVNGGGPVSIAFDSPVTDFQALFTHTGAITLDFLRGGALIGSAAGLFIDNLAVSGDIGSTPDEAISFHNDLGFDSVNVIGGGDYSIDDVTFQNNPPVVSGVPEPGSITLLASCAILTLCGACRKARISKHKSSDERIV